MLGRAFSKEFKLHMVRLIESGEKRPAQICREHSLANSVLVRWRTEYSERGAPAFGMMQEADTHETEREWEARFAPLQRYCSIHGRVRVL